MTVARAAFLSVLLALAGCGGSAEGPPTLILVVIDTMRADHLGALGYAQARTPELDRIAASGVRFTDAMTPVPVTLPAVTSLLTGRLPLHHGVRDNEKFVLSGSEVTLAERFREAGFRTGAVVGSSILSADRGLTQGFEVYDDAFAPPYPVYNPRLELHRRKYAATRRRADTVTDLALRQIDLFGDDPLFLFVHYFDVHTEYDPPPRYADLHPGRPYDGEISFVDAEVGRLQREAERRRGAVTLVVVADHGEGLGEHGEALHGFLLYQSTLHVPVLVAGPGIPAGLVRNDPISLVDLEPTLAAWFSLPPVEPARDGRRLDWEAPAAETPLYAETMRTLVSYGWSELRCLRRGKWKLIAGPRTELYDLGTDPGETRDLGTEGPRKELQADLAALVGDETREQVEAASRREDVDPGRSEVLESLGYLGGDAPAPKGAGEHTYPHPADELARWNDQQRLKSLLKYGITLVHGKKFREGLAVMDSVLARDSTKANAYYTRGVARLALEEPGGMADLERALELDPGNVPALVYLANLDERNGRLDRAFTRWRTVLGTELPPGFSTLELLASNPDLPPDLVGGYRKKAKEAPDDAGARLDLAIALYRSGAVEEGKGVLREFLALPARGERELAIQDLVGRYLTE